MQAEVQPTASTSPSKPVYSRRTTCRACGAAPLADVLSLGLTHISDFVPLDAPEQSPQAPLDLVLCERCSLLQLRHTTDPDLLWRQYWYRSGVNDTMRAALRDITAHAEKMAGLTAGNLVLDIGCNDGTLLRSYQTAGLRLAGFEPALNLQEDARVGATTILNDYFNAPKFHATFGNERARVITSISMFYDLEDPNTFVDGIAQCLAPGGLWINQMNYLGSMLEQNAFDNIGHEHLEYYSLISLSNLLDRHGLEIVDVSLNDLNGGSCRFYIRRKAAANSLGREATERVTALRAKEDALQFTGRAIYEAFAARVRQNMEKLRDFVQKEVRAGKRIYVYGASTRGSTLLQYAGLDRNWIAAAVERSEYKWGRKTTGTWIPIISEEQARLEQPDYFLVLPWFFIDEFVRREREYLSRGGRFIVPLPEFRLIGAEN